MSNNDRSKDQLKRLKETPLFKVTDSGINWRAHPGRAQIANNMTQLDDLNTNHHDEAIRRAFDYFGYDPADPYHWRILMINLAMALFPPRKKQGKKSLKTRLEDAELLKAVNKEIEKERNKSGIVLTDTDALKSVIKTSRGKYSADQIKALRKKLADARKAAGYVTQR